MFKAQNRPLVIAFILPLAVILFTLVSIYLPKLFIQPQYDFMYSFFDEGYVTKVYEYDNGSIVERYINADELSNNQVQEPTLYVHDVLSNKSRKISYEEAKKYTLIGSADSPDGYRIEYGTYRSEPFFLEDYDRSRNVYLVNSFMSKKMNIIRSIDTGYYSDIHFIGWIKRK